MEHKTRIIVIMDDWDLESAVRKQLEQLPSLFIASFRRVEDALVELSTFRYDLVISLYSIAGKSGVELLEDIRRRFQHIPVIFVVKDGARSISSETLYDAGGFLLESEIHQVPAKLPHTVRCLLRSENQFQHMSGEMERYLSIYNSLDEGIYIVDPETYMILSANAAAIRILGVNPVGKKCYEVLLGGSTEPCVHCDNAALARGILEPGALPWEFKRSPDDRWYRCVNKSITWTDGKFAKMEIIEDITDSRKADRVVNLLHVFRAKVRSLSDVAVIEFDKKGKISYTNHAAARLLGYQKKEIEEHFVWRFLDESGKVTWFQLLDVVSPKDSDSIECDVLARDRCIEAYVDIIFNRDMKDRLIDGILFIIEKPKKDIARFY